MSVERVVSGSALPTVYEFFASKYPGQAKEDILEVIEKKSGDPARLISQHADAGDRLCLKVLRLFVELYGAEAGDMSVKLLPYGGVYIAGGIALKIKKYMLEEDRFLFALRHKGRMKNILKNVPVYLVLQKDVGLLGSRVVARRTIERQLNDDALLSKL